MYRLFETVPNGYNAITLNEIYNSLLQKSRSQVFAWFSLPEFGETRSNVTMVTEKQIRQARTTQVPSKIWQVYSKKIQVPSTSAKYKHKSPSSKHIFSRHYCATMKDPRGRVLYRMFLMPPGVYLPRQDISCIMYKPLQTEWKPQFLPSRCRRPSPFDEGFCRYPRCTLYHCDTCDMWYLMIWYQPCQCRKLPTNL